MNEISPATELVYALVNEFGPEAHRIIDAVFDQLSIVEGACLEFDWPLWARAKQLPPATDWRSWGFLTGRGFGKTIGISKWINDEVERNGPILIGLAAQDEENSIAIQVNGPSGLIATAPKWNRPEFEYTAKQLVWPNGARAYVRTPEVPGKIRGLEYHLSWISEIQSWPVQLREEAFSNFLLSTRLGAARLVWDATPKRRHPILRELRDRSIADPTKHIVVRGTTHENAINLGPGYVEELEKKYKGTLKGREELLGEELEDSENAMVHQDWIDKHRRPMPDTIVRRVLSIDPAVTERKGSDKTGIIEAGTGADEQLYVLGDYSGKHAPPAWAKVVLDRYIRARCDLVIVETNKGGTLLTQNLRAAAKDRDLRVVVVGADEQPKHVHGVVHVKEVHSRGAKEDRAQPLATAYERGRVSHVRGVDLSSLEDTLTTWEPTPGAKSPDDLDALVAAAVELLQLSANKGDPGQGFRGISAMGDALRSPTEPHVLSPLVRGSGGRI